MAKPPAFKKIVATPKAPAAIGPYSQAVRAGGLLFISGQIAIDATTGKVNLFGGDVAQQCHLALTNLQEILLAESLTLEHVVKTTVYLKSMDSFSAMNLTYEKFFRSARPARATVAVAQLPAGVAVEIDAIAVYA